MNILHDANWRVGCHAAEPIVGRVVLVRSQADLSRVNKGDIIIAQQTDVNYTPQMLISAAIVTEDGGRYSHAATFSRENNIPCLIGVIEIMSVLTTGNVISIDTRAKTISIISPEIKGELS